MIDKKNANLTPTWSGRILLFLLLTLLALPFAAILIFAGILPAIRDMDAEKVGPPPPDRGAFVQILKGPIRRAAQGAARRPRLLW